MRKLITTTLLLITLLYCWQSAFCKPLDQEFQSWNSIIFTGNLPHTKKLLYLLDFHLRLRANSPVLNQGIAQVGFGMQASNRIQLWLQMGIYPTSDEIGNIFLEHRYWQQLNWIIIAGHRFQLISRTRFEQRLITSDPGVALRLRSRMLIKLPKAIDNFLTPVIFDEFFLDLNHPVWVSNNTFSQNRFFIGISFPTSTHSSLRVGYLNQFLFGDDRNEMNHIFNVYFRVNTS